MTEFTKGPWVKSKHGRLEGADGQAIAISGLSVTIQHYDDGEGIANANLIAAAPDMYEALKRVQTSIGGTVCEQDLAILDYCRAALAKAEGHKC